MTDLIKRSDALAALNSWVYCCDAEDVILALPAVDPAAIREAALREAAQSAWIFGHEKKDDIRQRILALIGEKK